MTKPLDLTPILRVPPETRSRLRAAVNAIQQRGEGLTIERLRQEAKVKKDRASLVVHALRQGLLDPGEAWATPRPAEEQPQTKSPDDLAEQILSATTDADRARINHLIAARIASGEIAGADARAIKELLGEARQSDKAARETASPDDAIPVLLCTPNAYQLCRVFDRIVGEEIRRQIEQYVLDASARDLEENPNPTPAEIHREKGEQK